MSRILVHRQGAFGDVLISSPLIRTLHNQGNEIVYVANERGVQVLKGNPHIKTLIEQKTDSVPINQLSDHIAWLQKKNRCDKVIDLSESIEVALSQHPRGPEYKLTKPERMSRFNRNFYEYCYEFADVKWEGESLLPELFFEQSELDNAYQLLKPNFFNILIGLSGSGTNKCWPWSQDFCYELVKLYPNIHILTVGDEKCKMIEPLHEQITNLSGRIPMRISMALTSLVDLVISPDTGLLHASGCYSTPKIGLLGHNTIECITKHFKNDYSVEADPIKAECSPCFFLIYNMKLQCPLNTLTQSSVCMADGISVDNVMVKFKEVYNVQTRPKS